MKSNVMFNVIDKWDLVEGCKERDGMVELTD